MFKFGTSYTPKKIYQRVVEIEAVAEKEREDEVVEAQSSANRRLQLLSLRSRASRNKSMLRCYKTPVTRRQEQRASATASPRSPAGPPRASRQRAAPANSCKSRQPMAQSRRARSFSSQ